MEILLIWSNLLKLGLSLQRARLDYPCRNILKWLIKPRDHHLEFPKLHETILTKFLTFSSQEAGDQYHRVWLWLGTLILQCWEIFFWRPNFSNLHKWQMTLLLSCSTSDLRPSQNITKPSNLSYYNGNKVTSFISVFFLLNLKLKLICVLFRLIHDSCCSGLERRGLEMILNWGLMTW